MDAKAEQLYYQANAEGNQQYMDDINNANTLLISLLVHENAEIIEQRLECAYTELVESTSSASKTCAHNSEHLEEFSPDHEASSSQEHSYEKSVAAEKMPCESLQEHKSEKSKFTEKQELKFNKKKSADGSYVHCYGDFRFS